MKKSLFTLFFFSFILFSLAQDFEVSPLKLHFNAEPGESQTKFITVRNHNSNTETIILNVSDISISSSGKKVYEDAGSMKYSIADWVSIAPSFFEIKPNEVKEIAVTMQQPIDEYGSRWGVVFIRTAQEQTSFDADKGVTAGMSVSARIAVDIYQTPGTNKSYKATIANLSEISASVDSVRTFMAVVNNLEDIITRCKVFLIATNLETAEETTFNEYEFVMYPKSSRKVELYLDKELPKGTYSLAAILDYGSRTNLEGTQTIIQVE